MVTVKVYVEGGGDSNSLRTRCRAGFARFFEKAGLKGRMPRVVACGTRRNAYDDFCTAILTLGSNEFVALLVDSEGPVAVGQLPWNHLRDREGDAWEKPANATDDHVHLMVQCMESWFLADRVSLAEYYGKGFSEKALPDNPKVEEIPKSDIWENLTRSSRETQKGPYEKGRHSFEILGRIDPAKVCTAAPFAKRLIDSLLRVVVS